MSDLPDVPSPDEILKQLERILASRTLLRCPRLKTLLRFVVQQTLVGRESDLKESVIGVEVFHLKPGWDAHDRTDVRTNAGRLRRKLRAYYETEGPDDPIVISIEPGGYVPAFAWSRDLRQAGVVASSATPVGLLTGNARAETPGWAESSLPQSPLWLERSPGVLVLASAAVLFTAARYALYGLAAGAVCILVLSVWLKYEKTRDSLISRALLALVGIAAMAYLPSVLTLIELMPRVVNLDTLRPAVIYPFVTGLKFIPLFVLVSACWVAFASGDAQPSPPKRFVHVIYIGLGGVFLAITAACVLVHSADDRIWRSGFAEGWAIAIGYAIILAANVAILIVGRGLFAGMPHKVLLARILLAYTPVIAAGYLVDHEYNEFNLYHLDLRRPQAYEMANPGMLARVPPSAFRADVGPLLTALLSDPAFRQSLATRRFFRQNFDEAFQAGPRATILGYRPGPSTSGPQQPFVMIRFPEPLVEALRFEPVAK